jgi:hypothetical protein
LRNGLVQVTYNWFSIKNHAGFREFS